MRRRQFVGAVVVVALLAWWLRPSPAEPEPEVAEKAVAPASPVPAIDAEAPAMRFDAPPPTDDVECELVAPITGPFNVSLVEYTPGTLEPLPPTVVDRLVGWVRFRPRHPEGLGQIFADGYTPATVAWIEGACLEPIDMERLPGGRVEITVEGEVDETVSFQTSCTPYSPEHLDGGRFAFETPQREPCEVRIGRQLGSRFFEGSVHPVDPSKDGVHVRAEAPPPIPSPGWSTYRGLRGPKVEALDPMGAAAAAGVERGDTILALVVPGGESIEFGPEIDGVSLEGEAVVEILRDDEILTLTIGEPPQE